MDGANNDAGEEEAVACDVCHIIRVRAADHSAAMHKVSQLPHELIVVRSCVLMEEILRRWKRFPLRNRPGRADKFVPLFRRFSNKLHAYPHTNFPDRLVRPTVTSCNRAT